MLVTLSSEADPRRVQGELAALGLWSETVRGSKGAVHLLVPRHSAALDPQRILELPGVVDVAASPSPHPLVDALPRELEVAGRVFGGARPLLIAGPCSVESPDSIDAIAARVATEGASFLRGGAFKPRSSPYAFQGHGAPALRWLADAAAKHGLGVITEALDEGSVAPVAELADIVQVGSRNMQNFGLLRAVGASGRPALLKRGMAATVDEWLLAGEYLLHHGAPAVLFCERGVRGFDERARNLLDLGSVALLATEHGLPVVVDPSHAVGRSDLITPLSLAARAAGAAALMIETHDAPGEALSDGPQALGPSRFSELARAILAQDPEDKSA